MLAGQERVGSRPVRVGRRGVETMSVERRDEAGRKRKGDYYWGKVSRVCVCVCVFGLVWFGCRGVHCSLVRILLCNHTRVQ